MTTPGNADIPWDALGALVRQARLRAGLSRSRVARLARLSESTLKNLEAGRHQVTSATLRALLAVEELALPKDLLGTLLPDSPPEGGLNAWIAPGFHPIDLYRQMTLALSGAGGHLEQTFAYFDTASAADWCAIAAQEDYAKAQDAMPLDRLAEDIAIQVGAAGLDLIALGPGDGRLETRLMGALARHLATPRGRFFLLDISQPLLGAAYQAAAAALAPFPAITPIAIQGDFHKLPQYTQILAPPLSTPPRRQLVAMLGGTFGNLDHEVRFLRDTLCGFGPGSLLLLDYPHVFGRSEEEIERRDPWLQPDQALRWQGAVASFLAGPLKRYCPAADLVELRAQRCAAGLSIAGSYAVEVIATVHARPQPRRAPPPPRRFSVFRLKRYAPEQVIAALRELGWDHVSGLAYGHDVGYVRTMSLFARRG